MSDFYGQLERQLVDAGRRRATHGRWRLALAGRGRPLLAVAMALLALVMAVAAAPHLRSDPSPGPAGSGASPAPPVTSPPPPAAGTPSLRGMRVAVLNGTTRSGAARAVAEVLEARGATIGSIGNAADQARAQTAVVYRPGAEAQARRVAAVLGVRDVRPRTRVEVVVAPEAAVVVHVGSDRRGP